MLSDSPEEYSPEPQQGFREEVTTPEFENIERARALIESAKTIFPEEDEKPIVASIIQEIIVDPNTPNEVKMDAFNEGLKLIDKTSEAKINTEIAQTLIDIVRSQKDPAIRLRLSALMSHSIQTGYFSKDIDSFASRIVAFSLLANSDKKEDGVYKNWAKTLLEPGEMLKTYNYLRDKESDLTITPKLIEEINDQAQNMEYKGGVGSDSETKYFTGNPFKLHPSRLPKLEKIRLYREMTGRDLPVFLTRYVGETFVTIEFPSDLTKKAAEALTRVREGKMSRDDLNDESQQLMREFMSRMNPEQRDELERHNLHVRFATERSVSKPPVEYSPPPTEIPSLT